MTRSMRHRTVASLVATAVLLAVAPAVAAAAPSVTVTPTDGLAPAGQTVKVTGSGFDTKPTVQPVNAGLYVALVGPGFDSSKMDSPSQGAQFIPQDKVIADNGAFTTDVAVKAQFGSGSGAVDCQVQQCMVRVWKAHLDADPTQRVTVPVSFAPTVALDRSTDLTAAGDEITVTGAGFKTAAPSTPDNAGLYVALVPGEYTTGSPTQGAQFVPQAQVVSGKGAFMVRLPVKAAFDQGGVDCLKVACAVRVWKAHTDADASQRVLLPVSFATPPAAAPPGASQSPPAPTPVAAPGPGVATGLPTNVAVTPRLSKLTVSKSAVSVSVSSVATVRATIRRRSIVTRRRHGTVHRVVRWTTVRTLTTRTTGAGRVKLAPKLGKGSYRVTVTATGASGAKSAPLTARLTVRR